MIPLNQLIPECLLALGGAFLLGNLAAYIRLRPAWRDARRVQDDQAAKRDAKASASAKASSTSAGSTSTGSTSAGSTRSSAARSGVTKATAPGPGARKPARAGPPGQARSKLPSQARVLTSVVVGLLITAAALATLIRA